MSDKSNPYLAFIDKKEEAPAPVVAPVAAPVVAEPVAPREEKKPQGEDYYVNPYLSFLDGEEKKGILDNQKVLEAGAGAAAGAAYKAHQMKADAKAQRTVQDPNRAMSSRGVQAYLNSQIPAKYNLPLKDLEKLVGKEIRTMAEVQAALKFIQGESPKRVQHVDVSGKPVNVFTTTPGREPMDLSDYERTFGKRVASTIRATPTVAGQLARGAASGAVMAPMAIQMLKQQEPVDLTQGASLLGSTLGMTRSGPLGALGLALQIPYIAKHGQEISSGLSLGEINPTVFGGAPEALETPIK